MKQTPKRIISGFLAAVTSVSNIVSSGLCNAWAAENKLDNLAVSLNLSVMSSDVVGLDIYARMNEDENPYLEYKNGLSSWNTEELAWDDRTGAFKTTVEIPASKMTDVYDFQFYVDDEKTGSTFSYSVADYAEEML